MKWICLFVIQLFYLPATAQLFKPAISTKTTFYYTLDLHGQQAPLELSVKSFTDTLILEWRIRRLASGSYAMTPEARQNASKLNFAQPIPNYVVKLPDNETFLILSRNAFKELLAKKECRYDNTVYDLEPDKMSNPIKIGDKQLDVLYITARDETTELWILNDADFPVICRIKNNPMGVDFF